MEFVALKSKTQLIHYLIITLSILLFIGQNDIVEPGSVMYWGVLLPAILIPFINFRDLVYSSLIKLWPILLMVLLTFASSLFKEHQHVTFRLLLLLWMLSWLSLNDLIIRVKTLSNIYIVTILVSIIVYMLFDFNHWSVFPGTILQGNSMWRVSFFPNIANTAFFSLFIFMVCTKDRETYKRNKFVVWVSLYFIIFSFVRTANISLALYLLLSFLFKKIENNKLLFIYSILAAIIVNIVIAYSVNLIHMLQSLPIIDKFLLRGEHTLTHKDIYIQLYRPWVWGQQWHIFTNSSFLMGEGVYDFSQLTASDINGPEARDDSVSLLLGMLAQYGLPTLLFYYYLLKNHYKNAMALDKWSCTIFPIIIFIAMQWGCVFHPAGVFFAMYFLILIKGKKAFF